MSNPSSPAPPAWIRDMKEAEALQGRIRSLLARAQHERGFGPASCRKAVNEAIQEAFETVAARVEAETRHRVEAVAPVTTRDVHDLDLLDREDVLAALAAPESQP